MLLSISRQVFIMQSYVHKCMIKFLLLNCLQSANFSFYHFKSFSKFASKYVSLKQKSYLRSNQIFFCLSVFRLISLRFALFFTSVIVPVYFSPFLNVFSSCTSELSNELTLHVRKQHRLTFECQLKAVNCCNTRTLLYTRVEVDSLIFLPQQLHYPLHLKRST